MGDRLHSSSNQNKFIDDVSNLNFDWAEDIDEKDLPTDDILDKQPETNSTKADGKQPPHRTLKKSSPSKTNSKREKDDFNTKKDLNPSSLNYNSNDKRNFHNSTTRNNLSSKTYSSYKTSKVNNNYRENFHNRVDSSVGFGRGVDAWRRFAKEAKPLAIQLVYSSQTRFATELFIKSKLIKNKERIIIFKGFESKDLIEKTKDEKNKLGILTLNKLTKITNETKQEILDFAKNVEIVIVVGTFEEEIKRELASTIKKNIQFIEITGVSKSTRDLGHSIEISSSKETVNQDKELINKTIKIHKDIDCLVEMMFKDYSLHSINFSETVETPAEQRSKIISLMFIKIKSHLEEITEDMVLDFFGEYLRCIVSTEKLTNREDEYDFRIECENIYMGELLCCKFNNKFYKGWVAIMNCTM